MNINNVHLHNFRALFISCTFINVFSVISCMEIAEYKEHISFNDHTAPVNSLAWSGYPYVLASGSDDQTIRIKYCSIYALKNRDLDEDIVLNAASPVRIVRWNTDVPYLIAGCNNGTIKIWQSPVYNLVATLTNPFTNQPITSLSCSPAQGQSYFIAACSGDAVWIWDANIHDNTYVLTGGLPIQTSVPRVVSWGRNINTLAVGFDDGRIGLWDIENNNIQFIAAHTHPITSLSWDPYGHLASSSTENKINLWDPRTNRISLIAGNMEDVDDVMLWDISFNIEGTHVIYCSVGDKALVATRHGGRGAPLKGHNSIVNAVCWLPEKGGLFIATASADHTVKIWKNQIEIFEHSRRFRSSAISEKLTK